MNCPNCGAQLHGDVLFCPYCGTKLSQPQAEPQPNFQNAPYTDPRQTPPGAPMYTPPPPPPQEPADNLATASMICGIISAILFCCGVWALPVAAIALGIVARTKGNRSTKTILGIVFGAIGLVLTLVYTIIVLVYYAQDVLGSGYYYYF